jgi:hypothetical protein
VVLASHADALHVKRLGIDFSIHRNREKLPETPGVHIGRGKNGLVHLPPGAGVVVVVSENVL